jgi:hypothetical protein
MQHKGRPEFPAPNPGSPGGPLFRFPPNNTVPVIGNFQWLELFLCRGMLRESNPKIHHLPQIEKYKFYLNVSLSFGLLASISTTGEKLMEAKNGY